jgi:hypothetical protein
LAGKDFWQPLLDYLQDTMVKEGTIGQADIDRFIVTDDPKEIAHRIAEVATRDFGLRRGKKPKPRWWLFEKAPFSGWFSKKGNFPQSEE